jgi:DNA invertase Pin-like site-specific DNA recombinase
MARTARNRIIESPVEQRTFHVGIYARLSVEGDERKNESIDTQIEIAKQFMYSHPEMTLYDIYIDLGATGTNFEREGFQRMLQDVRQRNIDCIIVKDLSRFGRNCVETGNYIQKIFPFMNVRFIAVADSVDTFNPEHTPDDLTVNLKNLVNEMYAKDIAQKVRTSKQTHWDNGSYMGGVAPYGYNLDWNGNKKTLIINPEAAEIVRQVYSMYLDEKNIKQIIQVLFEKKVHTPTSMRSSGHVYQQEGETLRAWNRGAIKTLLTSPVYIGWLVQATTSGKKYQFRALHDIDSEDYSMRANTHEAIISEEDFYKVAEKFEKTAVYCNKNGFQKKVPMEEDIYQDVLFCGDCGKQMTRTSHIKELGSGDRIRWYGYRCSNTDTLDIKCPVKGIAKAKLDELVLSALEQEFKLSNMRQKTVVERCKKAMNSYIAGLEKEKAKVENTVAALNKRMSDLYVQYRMENMPVNEYQKQKEQLNQQMIVYGKQLENYDLEICNKTSEIEEKCTFLRNLIKCKKKKFTLTRDVITTLIKRIEVYADYKVKIQFAFRMNELLEKEMTKQCQK